MTTVLHADEVNISLDTVRRLVDTQFPRWSELELRPGGSGTDNVIFRLGERLCLRLPRRPGTAPYVLKEAEWLPSFAGRLPAAIPVPVALGEPNDEYPFPWLVLEWATGEAVDPDALDQPERFGADLARFVAALHGIELAGARRESALTHYRGGPLRDQQEAFDENLRETSSLPVDVDLAAVRAVWDRAMAAPPAPNPHTWMHTDLRPANLLIADGRLSGVIDFGGLSVGDPTCEHAAVWDLPEPARRAYVSTLGLNDDTWATATAWAATIALSAIPYYWATWPAFVQESVRRLRRITGQET